MENPEVQSIVAPILKSQEQKAFFYSLSLEEAFL